MAHDENRQADGGDRTTVHEGVARRGRLMAGGRRTLRPLQTALGVSRLQRRYLEMPASQSPEEFATRALVELGTSYDITAADLARVPATGPVVVVANHPFGGVEGLALVALLRSVRRDVKVLANRVLLAFPELDQVLIPVEAFGGRDATATNARALRQALRVLEGGGLVAVFPAGTVSHLGGRPWRITDPEWSAAAARLAMRSGAAVVPLWVGGHNGVGFQLLGLVHPLLRTALLARELQNKRGRTIPLRVGGAVTGRRLGESADEHEATVYLRARTYALALRARERRSTGPAPAAPRREEVAAPRPLAAIEAELDALGACQRLVESGEMSVVCASAVDIPNLLHEIGRQRELAFRAAGEGTGKALDLDRFDTEYLHLVVWDRAARRLVGAYRLGPTDRLVGGREVERLYTSTLFRYSPALFERMGPALELGRSFITAEYRRSFSPLLLLWRGIGAFVVRHPRYRHLFGPVSISASYCPASRALIAAFLRENLGDHPWGRLVRPRRPFRAPRGWRRALLDGVGAPGDLEDANAFLADLEGNAAGVPVLLRQYLKLGGRVLGLNVDADFSDVLDALVVVDLTATEPRTLEKYMGRDGAASFLRWQARHAHRQVERRDVLARVVPPSPLAMPI